MADALSDSAGRLTLRISWIVIAAAAVVVLVGTTVHGIATYRSSLRAIEAQRSLIAQSLLPGIAAAAFDVDEDQVATQLGGLLEWKGVVAARVVEEVGGREETVAVARPGAGTGDTVWRMPLYHAPDAGPPVAVGELEVVIDRGAAVSGMWRNILAGFLVNVAVVAVLALLVILLLERLLMRHLRSVARQVSRLALADLQQPLTLDRRAGAWARPDELDTVVAAWNRVRTRLLEQIGERSRIGERIAHEQKMEALGLLAGGVAHDTNNMLTALQGAVTMISEELPENRSPAIDGHLRVLGDACRTLHDLNRNLLTFARHGERRGRAFDLHRSLERLEMLLRHGLAPTIVLDIEAGAGCTRCLGDPAALESAVINLVVNACDALEGRGRIRIATRDVDGSALPDRAEPASERWVALSVRDDGPGMDEGTQARIFEPFFTTKGVGKGTGLGLPGVEATVRRMGGTVTVDSAPGRGTTITLWLPVDPELEVIEEPGATLTARRASNDVGDNHPASSRSGP